MPRKADPGNYYIGKVCPKHPELAGLRLRHPNFQCVQCGRDQSKAKYIKRKEKEGVVPEGQIVADMALHRSLVLSRSKKWA